MVDSETLDTLHAGILFVGVVLLGNTAISQRWFIPLALGVILAWVVGYYTFVKLVLPPRWSGQ